MSFLPFFMTENQQQNQPNINIIKVNETNLASSYVFFFRVYCVCVGVRFVRAFVCSNRYTSIYKYYRFIE